MADLEKAIATQLANIEKRTGKSIAQLVDLVRNSGLSKHGEKVAMLKTKLGMGHGDANTLVHHAAKGDQPEPAPSAAEALDALYVGDKAALRPIHDKLLEAMRRFGAFEEAPKKSYVSYRRKKQFATIGPATKTRVELGLNAKGLKPTARLEALPAGQMCQYKVKLTSADEVDAEVLGWLRAAWEQAG